MKEARSLAAALECHGENLQKRFSQYEIDTLLNGDLGEEIKKYPNIVARIKQNGPAAPGNPRTLT